MQDAALRLKALMEQLLGAPVPVRIRAWDGSEAGPPRAPYSSYGTAGLCADCCGSLANWAWHGPGSPGT
jgi:hypothetical protein